MHKLADDQSRRSHIARQAIELADSAIQLLKATLLEAEAVNTSCDVALKPDLDEGTGDVPTVRAGHPSSRDK